MSTRRVVLGKRANGDIGIFVAPAGVDAFTASDAALILNVSSKVSQLLLLGITNGSVTIPLGLSRSPLVFVTSQFDFSGVIGHTAGPGPMRPSPLPGGASSNATVNSNGASVTIAASVPTTYAIYSQAFT